MCVLGIKIGFCCLHSKHLYQLSHLHVLSTAHFSTLSEFSVFRGLSFCFCFFNGSPSYPRANVSEDRNHSLASGPSLHCYRSAFFFSLATSEVLYVLVLSMQTLEPLFFPYLGSFLDSPHPLMSHSAAGYHQGLRGEVGRSGIALDILRPLNPAHRILSSIMSFQSLKAHPPNQSPCLLIHSEHHLLP